METKVEKGKFNPSTFLGIWTCHIFALFGIWYGFAYGYSWKAWACFAVQFLVNGLGTSVSYHRYFTHRAFTCSPRMEKFLAGLGSFSCQGLIGRWVRSHRRHHAWADTIWDMHSPVEYPGKVPGWRGVLKAFWWSHMGWLWRERPVPPNWPNPDLSDEPAVIWQKRWHWPIISLGFIIPYLVCGWEGVILAGFPRIVYAWHITWCVNSICHMFGTKVKSLHAHKDESRNNIWLTPFTWIGENWHGNHHAYPNSPWLGRKWWQIDFGNYFVWLMKKSRLIWIKSNA